MIPATAIEIRIGFIQKLGCSDREAVIPFYRDKRDVMRNKLHSLKYRDRNNIFDCGLRIAEWGSAD